MKLCRWGYHRHIIREHRTLSRIVTAEGETTDVMEERECNCGEIIRKETHQHSNHRVEISRADN